MDETQIAEAVGTENLVRHDRKEFQQFYSELGISDIDIAGYNFNLSFQMAKSTNTLSQVLIMHEANLDSRPKKEFDAALLVLRERFGSPQRVGTSENMVWIFPSTTIAIGITYIDGIMSFLSIRFFPTVAGTKHQAGF